MARGCLPAIAVALTATAARVALLWPGIGLSPAAAFEAEEHKLVGDLGAYWALSWLPAETWNLDPSVNLVKPWSNEPTDTSGGNAPRLLNRAALRKLLLRKDREFSEEGFYAREGALEPPGSLLIWVGKTDKDMGSYFTLGDLVATYGDLRRTITCDYASFSWCSLTDSYLHWGRIERQTAVRDFAVGWRVISKVSAEAMWLQQLWWCCVRPRPRPPPLLPRPPRS